jgi:hypothetical protein
MKGSKGFAVGKDNANSVLKWRITSEDESLVPIQRIVFFFIHHLLILL